MRFAWCLSYSLAALLLYSLKMYKKYHLLLFPILAMQSVFCIGILILSLTSIPKLLHWFFEPSAVTFGLIMVFIVGNGLNYFLTFLLWHMYWFLEESRKPKKKPNAKHRDAGGTIYTISL